MQIYWKKKKEKKTKQEQQQKLDILLVIPNESNWE